MQRLATQHRQVPLGLARKGPIPAPRGATGHAKSGSVLTRIDAVIDLVNRYLNNGL